MKMVSNIFLIIGLLLIAIFGYNYMSMEKAQENSLEEAEARIAEGKPDWEENTNSDASSSEETQATTEEKQSDAPETGKANPTSDNADFSVQPNEAFATLEIPKLGKTLPVVEGTDPDDLEKGVGHLSQTVYPGEQEQIIFSGHRDTVFRDFGELEIGDQFVVTMPYGTFEYEIRETEIVPEDDTSVVRNMGEEVLVVTTCYPFSFVGSAPDRFVAYAYPVG